MFKESIVVHNTRLAIVGSQGLGDSLLQMILANNLQRNGYRTTLYNDYSNQFVDYVSDYEVQEYPSSGDLLACLEKNHVVLYDQGSHYIKSLPNELINWFERNALPFRLSSSTTSASLISHHELTEKLRHEHQAAEIAMQLMALNRSLRTKSLFTHSQPLVRQIVKTLQDVAGLQNVIDGTGLSFQGQRSVERIVANRVLIHPTSSRTQKNWTPKNYLEFSYLLQQRGYEVVVTVSPKERSDWLKLADQKLDVPLFENVKMLAEYYTTAAFFVGNDSGNAHLASCIGLPTFQLFHGWKKYPSWRAGWGENKVVNARSPFKYLKNHWQKGLAVDFVIREFDEWVDHLKLSI